MITVIAPVPVLDWRGRLALAAFVAAAAAWRLRGV